MSPETIDEGQGVRDPYDLQREVHQHSVDGGEQQARVQVAPHLLDRDLPREQDPLLPFGRHPRQERPAHLRTLRGEVEVNSPIVNTVKIALTPDAIPPRMSSWWSFRNSTRCVPAAAAAARCEAENTVRSKWSRVKAFSLSM